MSQYAYRHGKWKLLVKKGRAQKGKAKKNAEPAAEIMLFDLNTDIGEENNLASANPEVVEALQKRMAELDAEIAENARVAWEKEG